MHIGGLNLGWFRRRWWVIAASVVIVTGIAFLLSPPAGNSYTARAVLNVRSGATSNTPGSANEANRLAVTYAELAPQDTQVLDRVARVLGTSNGDVGSRTTVINGTNSSSLEVVYRASSPGNAIEGARAYADALAGPTPASSNFNGLGIVSLPGSAQRNDSVNSAIPTSFVLGLALGIVLVIAWERRLGKIDSESDLRDELTCPVSSLESLSAAQVVALMERWRILSLHSPSQIAVLPVVRKHSAVSAEIAEVCAETVANDPEASEQGNRLKGLSLHTSGAPGTTEAGEGLAQRVDLTVLVVPQGAPASSIRASVDKLGDFGVYPGWALFAGRRMVSRARRKYKDDDVVVGTVDIGAVAASASAPSKKTVVLTEDAATEVSIIAEGE